MTPASIPANRCDSCGGTGEMGTENGLVDCADCGGSGQVPEKSVLTDWRVRDIERAMASGVRVALADIQWLIRELRGTRRALSEVVALAHDIPEDIGVRVRRSAQHALGVQARPDGSPASVRPDSTE